METAKVKIDTAPPHNLTFSGLPSSHELVDGQHYALKASATDGSEGKTSSGIASIVLKVDGQSIGSGQGYCPRGPCTGNAEWTLSGESYAAGEHTLTVIATDNAGNLVEETVHVKIHHPEGVTVGPGTVNPVTGEVSVAATDVSVGVPGGVLAVSRSYRSRHLAQGTEGPLGPQWSLALGVEQSLYRVSGGMILAGGVGGETIFESKGGGEFTSPTGDTGLTLLEKVVEGKTIFRLSDNGSVTTFELPAGSSGSVWMPSSSEGPNGTDKMLYKFKLTNGVIEPTEELAPEPAGVSCGKEISELKEGCRALKFEYDEGETTAKGEKLSEWGEFKGHLSKVKYIAWNASKTKTEPVVAEYAYDKQGQLRAEWNPEIKPELKTIYGYDNEGHVTAVSTSGHEPSLLEQGTTPNDASPGRLLAVAVPSAGTALGNGEAPENKEAPTLSTTTPKVGVKISVSLTSEKTPGKWSANPLAFIYQWEDCNTSSKECSPIRGAVNQAYYPVASDEGHVLVAEVIALNATGATTASSAATATVAAGTPNTLLPEPPAVGSNAVTTLEYQVPTSGSSAPYEMGSTKTAEWGQIDDPEEAMAIFPPNKVMGWPAKEYKHETVYYLDGKDRTVNVASPTGGIATAEYNRYNDITRALSPDNRSAALKEVGKTAEAAGLLSTESHYNGESKEEEEREEKEVTEKLKPVTEPGTELLSTLGPRHTVKLAVGKEGKVNEETLARKRTNYSYNEGAPSEGGPYHLVTKLVEEAETSSKEIFDARTTETSYSGQSDLGWKLHKPTSVTTDPGGLKLAHRITYDKVTGNVIETSQPMLLNYVSQFGSKGSGNGQLGEPRDVALDSKGDLWVADTNNHHVEEFSATGTYLSQFGTLGSGNGQFSEPKSLAIDSKDNIWVSDQANNCVQEFNKEGKFMLKVTTANGKAFSSPQGIVTDSKNNVWVADRANNRIVELNESGGYAAEFGTAGSGNGQFKEPIDVAVDSNNNVLVLDMGNSRVQKFNSKLEYVTKFGSAGAGNGQFKEPKGMTVDQAGNVWVADSVNARLEEFSSSGEYLGQYGSSGTGNGQFKEPRGIALNSAGTMWVVDVTNYRVEQLRQATAHNTKTIYYTTAANTEYAACGEHREMANLPCETTPAEQPGTSGLPELPATKYTYNIWGEPETTTETVGSTKRTTTDTYDAAGRPKTTATSSTVGEPVATITDEYNKETGALEKQCANEGKPCTEGTPKTIIATYNKLGELVSYTDSDANATTYEYEGEGSYTGETEHEGHLRHINDGKGSETYTYNEATGLPAELLYEYTPSKLQMAFTATYDAEGKLLTETYPNNMTASYTYNQIGEPTTLEYTKNGHCAKTCPETWFSDNVTPSIHGQWLEQTSSLSHQAYAYDSAGRLTQVQNTVNGKCTTRIYAYDEDTNRTSLTTREPGTEGKCAAEGGTVQEHTYDTADRLTDPGVVYNAFGDITNLSAGDAEEAGTHALTTTYYADNQVASQTQNEQTIGFNLDPDRRTLETIATGKPNNSTTIDHYAGPSNSPAWTTSPISGEWTRNITGINGSLAAIQNNGETPELQLINLHGDIIAKASASETTTELAAKADTSEYGVPTVAAPAKYSWLGAIQTPTELPSGVINMGARSYVPQIGRFLQPDPIPGGSANPYAYTFGDPVNTNDPSGAYTNKPSEKLLREEDEAVNFKTKVAEAEAAARKAAEEAARAAEEAEAEAAAAAGPQYNEGEEWEEWWEEESEYGYVSDDQGTKSASEEHHVEPAILVEPLSGEEAGLHAPIAGPVCSTSRCKRERRHNRGSANEGGTGRCRSGGPVVNGKCQQGPGNVPNNCAAVGSAAGGAAGGVFGGYGALVGGAIGGAAGQAACGNSKT